MRIAVLLATILSLALGAAPGRAQSLLAKPTVQYATVVPAQSTPNVSPGGSVTLWADVTPNPSMHVYAAGAKDFTPVSLVLTPHPALSAGTASYPKAASIAVPGVAEQVPAYSRLFRISVPITVKPTVRAGEVLTIGAALNYQTCDDRLCYPVAVAPVLWKIEVK